MYRNNVFFKYTWIPIFCSTQFWDLSVLNFRNNLFFSFTCSIVFHSILNLMGVRWHFSILICIFVITGEFEHLFINLLLIWSSYVNCLFIFSAHFFPTKFFFPFKYVGILYTFWSEYSAKYMCGKYLHLLCDLSFHFVLCAFCHTEVLTFNTTKISSLLLYGLYLLCVV